ncbi:cell wall biogenesis protein, partial [bacterium I07]
MKIPFFDYPKLYKNYNKTIDISLKAVLEKGAFILQTELIQFEETLASYCRVKHAIGVANGTDALWLSLMAVNIGKGDEVIVPSHTYIASPASIKFVGAKPVLAECSEDHLIDPDKIESLITSKTKAIMPVQLNGRTAQMDKLIKLASKYDLIIIEDSAQGLGSQFKGKMAGTFGLTGTYSFYPAKVLGCFGDGGAVVTNNDGIAKKIKLLRDHGRDDDGEIQTWGFNSRLDNIQAAILLAKMKSFPQELERRREIANLY